MFVETHAHQSWSVWTGVIDRFVDRETSVDQSLEDIVQHEFVGDTTDGGLAICFSPSEGRSVPFFMNGPDGAKIEGTAQEILTKLQQSSVLASIDHSPHMLSAACHCGGVKFQITRPNANSRNCSSPWPDLVVPYHSSSSANPQDVKWWLRENDTKYLAGTCACRSCRLGSGSPIQTWAFIPKANIIQLDGRTLDYEMGTLKQIESSSGCFREFCGRCGATVFWHCLERPDLVDVSVGLLRAPEGSRAVTWLDWWVERVSFREDAFDKQLIDKLEKGLHHIKQPSTSSM